MKHSCLIIQLLAAMGVLTLVPPVATAAGNTVAADLAQCAAISASDARLACYDTLAGRATKRADVAATAAPASAPTIAAVPAPAPTIAAAAAPVPKSAAVAAGTVTPASSVPVEDASNFGLSGTQLYTAAQKAAIIQAIQAHVAQVATDQLRSRYVTLDNGQTWISTSGDMNLNVGEAVTIKRAALGSFMLISAAQDSYHVRRVR